MSHLCSYIYCFPSCSACSEPDGQTNHTMHRHVHQWWCMQQDLLEPEGLGAPSQKTSLLGGVAQILISPRPSPRLADVGLFVRPKPNNPPSNKESAVGHSSSLLCTAVPNFLESQLLALQGLYCALMGLNMPQLPPKTASAIPFL